MCVASAATGIQVLSLQHRLRPIGNVSMGVRGICCPPLAAMANRAAVGRWIVNDIGMTAEKSIPFDAALARRHADVATHASIRRTYFAADDLSKLNGEGVGLGRRQLRCNFLLNDAPVAKKVFFHRRPDQYCERHQAGPEKKMFIRFHLFSNLHLAKISPSLEGRSENRHLLNRPQRR